MKSSKILSGRLKKPTQHCSLLKIKTDFQNERMLGTPVKCLTLHLGLLLSYFSELDSEQHNLWTWWWLPPWIVDTIRAATWTSELQIIWLAVAQCKADTFSATPLLRISDKPFFVCHKFPEFRQLWRWLCQKIFRKKSSSRSLFLNASFSSKSEQRARQTLPPFHAITSFRSNWNVHKNSAFHQVRDVLVTSYSA